MPLILLTGRQERVHQLALDLKAGGFDVHEGPGDPGLIAAGSVDCHIHLTHPDDVRLGDLPGDRCRIVFISEPVANGVAPSDVALLRALVEAALDRPGRRVRVEIVDEAHSLGEPTASTRTGRPDWSRYAELEPDLSYADWRNEVMAIASGG